MAQLLRGPQENYNPQIHTEGNSLAVLMNKHMAVKNKALSLFSRFNKITSWASISGRTNGGAAAGKIKKGGSEVADNAYRVFYEGALFIPAYSFGAVQLGSLFVGDDMSGVNGVTYTNGKTASTITTDTIGTIAVKHEPANNIWGDKFNETDEIALGGGLGIYLIIMGSNKRLSSTGDHYIYDVKTIGPATAFNEADLAEDQVLTDGGNAQGEGSLKQYQRSTKNSSRIVYSSIHRYTLTMTGSAKRQKVQFIYNGNDRKNGMWEYVEVLKAEKFFAAANEMHSRFSRTTMDPTGHKWFENWGLNKLTLNGFSANVGLTAPMQGDGYIPQIIESGVLEYNPNSGMAISLIKAGMMIAAQRSPIGPSGNTFLLITDTLGRMVIDEALKKLISWGESTSTNTASNVVINIATGQKNSVGFEMDTYHYLGNKVVVVTDELLSNPGFFNTNGGVTGTGNIYLINASSVDGVSNFEMFNGANGRGYIKKYIDGMHSFGEQTSKAASGFDGMRVDLLAENMPIVYDVKSSVIFKANAVYNGGALQGTQWLSDNPNAMSYLY